MEYVKYPRGQKTRAQQVEIIFADAFRNFHDPDFLNLFLLFSLHQCEFFKNIWLKYKSFVKKDFNSLWTVESDFIMLLYFPNVKILGI
jgi:hypothetical protein